MLSKGKTSGQQLIVLNLYGYSFFKHLNADFMKFTQ